MGIHVKSLAMDKTRDSLKKVSHFARREFKENL